MINGSAQQRKIRPRWPLLAAISGATAAAVAVAVIVAGGSPSPGPPPGRRLPDLAPRPAPPGWPSASLPSGNAVLVYPPTMRQIGGDTGSISAARYSRSSGYLLYLNATPREGSESIRNFPRLRLHLLRADNAASAHEIAVAAHVKFRGGTGSCILDSYLTKIGRHHYDELACFVQGRTSASVVVAAAPASVWAASAPLLVRAVAAYRVR